MAEPVAEPMYMEAMSQATICTDRSGATAVKAA
jgi:hypothetical protein